MTSNKFKSRKRPFIDIHSISRTAVIIESPLKKKKQRTITEPERLIKRTQRKSISKRAEITLPVTRIRNLMKRKQYAPIITKNSAIFLAAATEYCLSELLKSSSQSTKAMNRKIIQPRNVMFALKDDSEFASVFANVIIPYAGVVPDPKLSKHKKLKTQNNNKEKQTALKETDAKILTKKKHCKGRM